MRQGRSTSVSSGTLILNGRIALPSADRVVPGAITSKAPPAAEAAKTLRWFANDADIDLLHRGNGLHSPVPSAAEKESAVSLGR
jgi:hypothetical protein